VSLEPDALWYREIVAAVEAQQAGVVDRLGRPWAEHFQRVAMRLIFRSPTATRAQIEAALLHDVLMDRGGGTEILDRLAVGADARQMIRVTTPPQRRPLPRV
jgi:(p)ppGpp synthase/HD superfamily hydrolase